jgi:hypothetical protein
VKEENAGIHYYRIVLPPCEMALSTCRFPFLGFLILVKCDFNEISLKAVVTTF